MRLHRSNFVLNDFLKGIAGELSFLVGTFFFVLLGILVNFKDVTSTLLIEALLMIGVLFGVRLALVPLFRWLNKGSKWGETLVHVALAPRGLATAVSAFTPAAAPYFMKGTDNFPLIAMAVILGSNLLMTALVGVGETLLSGKDKSKPKKKPKLSDQPVDVLSGLDVPRPPIGGGDQDS
jgi:NhaP-type Na+/H+ or K+/H+ antiporter